MPVISDQLQRSRRARVHLAQRLSRVRARLRRGGRRRRAEHFLRVRERWSDEALAAEHARDFGHARFAVDRLHVAGHALAVAACLATTKWWSAQAATCGRCVTASTCAVAAQLLHQAAHGFGHRAADAGVDLVEDQRRAPSR